MKKIDDYSNDDITKMVMFATVDEAKVILKKEFPASELHHIHVFSNGNSEILIDNRHIKIKKENN